MVAGAIVTMAYYGGEGKGFAKDMLKRTPTTQSLNLELQLPTMGRSSLPGADPARIYPQGGGRRRATRRAEWP